MKSIKLCGVSAAVAFFGLCGCSRMEAIPAETVALTDESLELLALADAHDGTVDKVVEDCATCKLHMKGSADITTDVGGYTAHLCSPRCKQAMETDPNGVLALLDLNSEDAH